MIVELIGKALFPELTNEIGSCRIPMEIIIHGRVDVGRGFVNTAQGLVSGKCWCGLLVGQMPLNIFSFIVLVYGIKKKSLSYAW